MEVVKTSSGSRASRSSARTRAPAEHLVDARDVRAYLRRVATLMERHRDTLARLDRAIGDGDHGDNMAVGFGAVVAHVASDDTAPMGEFLVQAGRTLVTSGGGSASLLYSAALVAAGLSVGGRGRADLVALDEMIGAAVDAVARRGRCAVGDKTLFDVLRPAADAFHRSVREGAGLPEASINAVRAARGGLRATHGLVARRGLALRLGPDSVGHLDPGAASALLLVSALGRP